MRWIYYYLTFSDTKVTSRDKTLLPYNMEGFKGIDIACMKRGVSQVDLFLGQKSKSTNIYDSVILFSYLCYRERGDMFYIYSCPTRYP